MSGRGAGLGPPRKPFETTDEHAAALEMIRRQSKWGGTWVVCKHPAKLGSFIVGLAGVTPGSGTAKEIRRYPAP